MQGLKQTVIVRGRNVEIISPYQNKGYDRVVIEYADLHAVYQQFREVLSGMMCLACGRTGTSQCHCENDE